MGYRGGNLNRQDFRLPTFSVISTFTEVTESKSLDRFPGNLNSRLQWKRQGQRRLCANAAAIAFMPDAGDCRARTMGGNGPIHANWGPARRDALIVRLRNGPEQNFSAEERDRALGRDCARSGSVRP